MEGPVLEQCANGKAMKVIKTYKVYIIDFVVTKTITPHHMPERSVIRPHLSFQITHHDITFKKYLLNCIKLLVESLLLLYIGNFRWAIELHDSDIP